MDPKTAEELVATLHEMEDEDQDEALIQLAREELDDPAYARSSNDEDN